MKKRVFSLIAIAAIALATAGCQTTEYKPRNWGEGKSESQGAPSAGPSHVA